jgi:hypothetical protein
MGVVLGKREAAEIGDGLLEIEVLARGPQGENLFPFPKKLLIRPALIV